MTDEVNTQAAVTTTETPATPAVEGTNAQAPAADLESILAEFDQGTKAAPQPAPQQPAQAVPPDALKRIELLEKTLAEKDSQDALKPVIEAIRGELPKDVLSNEEVLDLIDGRAKRDPRIQRAWMDRANNPGAWSKIQKGLAKELSKKFSKLPDPNATEDREAVTAAVRGASGKAPEEKAPNYGAMTQAEFNAEKARLGL